MLVLECRRYESVCAGSDYWDDDIKTRWKFGSTQGNYSYREGGKSTSTRLFFLWSCSISLGSSRTEAETARVLPA